MTLMKMETSLLNCKTKRIKKSGMKRWFVLRIGLGLMQRASVDRRTVQRLFVCGNAIKKERRL